MRKQVLLTGFTFWLGVTMAMAQDVTTTPIPQLPMPKLASMQIRVDSLAEVIGSNGRATPFAGIVGLRAERDNAITKVAGTELKGNVSATELGHLADAVLKINQVCNLGTDYIQHRLQRNSSHQFLTGLFVGLFATVGVAAPVISSAKVGGVAALLASQYKTDIIENGDSGHSNQDLKLILADIRQELATGIRNYNQALLMPSISQPEKLSQYRHLQAAMFEMNNACA